MLAEVPELVDADAFVLRVLAGRMRGAEHPLPLGKSIRVGHAFDHDIVLRCASARGVSFELHLGDEVATIRVVAGSVALLGRTIGAGQEFSLPRFMPLAIGDVTISIGEATSARWDEAQRLSQTITLSSQMRDHESVPLATAPRAGLGERMATRLHPWRERVAVERHWPLYGVAAGGLLLVALAAGPVHQVSGQFFDRVESGQTLLAANGFPALTVRNDPAGGIMIAGIVRDDAELGRLRNLVAAKLGRATIDVDTMQALAASATDMLRAQGVDAEAKPMRGTALLVATEYLPTDRQAELEALIKRDLPGITRVAFANQNVRGDRDLQYFFSGGPFGLATFVDGDPGYITTADGTRWFAGSQVPTGHKILAIGNGRVSFERDGRVEELMLGAAPPPVPMIAPPSGDIIEGLTT